MNAPPTASMLRALPAEHRHRIMRTAREVSFPQGTRLFEEGGRADRFWVIRTGTVELDMRVPGRQPAVIESLGHNELIGWSWLFTPYIWHMGAEATSPVRAYEFDGHDGPLDVQRRPRTRLFRSPMGGRRPGAPPVRGPHTPAGPVRPYGSGSLM